MRAPNAEIIILGSRDYSPFVTGKDFHFHAQRGQLDLFFISAIEIDQHGNFNLHVIGDRDEPDVLMPGQYGTGMLYYAVPRIVMFRTEHTRRSFVDKVNYVSGAGTSPNGVSRRTREVKVITPIDDTPAQRAGLEPGDYVTHLDGEPILGLTLAEAVERMRGPIDSGITLTIMRPGAEANFDVEIIRAVITILSVRTRMEGDDVAYVRISSFSEKTTRDLEKEINKLRDENGETLVGLVLDLRNNPGGLLNSSVDVADALLDGGLVVYTEGRIPSSKEQFYATAGDVLNGIPVVVLINEGSASAAEIVAGALQDHHRAVLLGTSSFGKGSVQTVIPLGAERAIKLTTARYYTPNKRSIQAEGIQPDIIVRPAEIHLLETQKQIKEANLTGHLSSGNDKQSADKDDLLQTDNQLYEAINLLQGLEIFSRNTSRADAGQ